MKNALGHISFGILLISIFAGLASIVLPLKIALGVAWAMQCAYWLGRERRDEEIIQERAGNPIAHGLKALTHWNLFTWTSDGRKDLLAPVLVNGLLVYFVIKYGH